MNKLGRMIAFAASFAALAAISGAPARAIVLQIGQSGTPDLFTEPLGTPVGYWSDHDVWEFFGYYINAPGYSAVSRESSGTLDFVYSVTNSSLSTDRFDDIYAVDYGNWIVDFGYRLDGGATISPLTVSRNRYPTGTQDYVFGLGPSFQPGSTAVVEIKTNATTFRFQTNYEVEGQWGPETGIVGFANPGPHPIPAPVPEPGSLLGLGSGLLCLLIPARRRTGR